MRPDAVCYLCSAVRTESTWKEFLKFLDGLDVKVLIRKPAQWEGLAREEFLAGRCPGPRDLDMDLSQGLKVASAMVWLANSPRASGWHLTNWAKAVEGLQVQQMRELVDRVYREDTERFSSFGIFAGMHSSIPMKELEEL
ncbi:hypothetical protein FOZ63_014774, partial [Perkinsus olseni]